MKKILCAYVVSLLATAAAQAEVVAEFNFAGNAAASSDSSIYSTVSVFNVGVGAISGDLVSASGAETTQSGDVDPAGAGAQYHSFTVTVTNLDAGETLDLTSLTYTYTVLHPLNFAVGLYSSVDGFASTAAQLDGVDTGTDYTNPQTFNQTATLSGSGFQGLENNDVVEFRFYLADGSSSASRTHQLDDIVLNGSVQGGVEEGIDVYLIAGQSNADGRAATNDLTGRLAGWAGEQTNAPSYYANPINGDPINPSYLTGWTNMMPGFSVAPGYTGDLPSPTFGPGISFGKMMVDSDPNQDIALIKVTKGGSNLHSNWSPAGNGFMWQTFTNHVTVAMQQLADAGETATIRGLIWHQGESDISRTSAEYTADLTSFLAAVRSFTGVANLPIVMGELSDTYSARTVDMNAVAELDPNTSIASSDGLVTQDGTHFNPVSQLRLGRRFAATLQSLPETSALVDNDTLVFFGDSITAAGTDPDGYITLFAADVAAAYPSGGIQVIGAGVGGNKVADLMARLDADVLSHNPSIVVIYIGINDVWHWTKPDPVTGLPREGTTAENYHAGLLDLVQRVKATGGRAVLCTPTVISEAANPDDPNYVMLEEFSAICRTVAQQTGSQLVDLRNIFTDYNLLNNTADATSGILTSDTVHMNATGNQLIADTLVDAFSVAASTNPGITITQTGANSVGESWETGADWSDGNPASAGNDYVNQTSGWTTRTPGATGPVFPGVSLTMTNGAILRCKHSGTASISDLIISAGSQLDNGGASCAIDGNLALVGSGSVNFDSQIESRLTTIESLVTADSTIDTININMTQTPWTAPSDTGGFVLNNASNVFSGIWNVSVGMLKGAGLGSASFNVGALGYLDIDGTYLNTNANLTIESGGVMLLDEFVSVGSATIWGAALAPGIYSGADLRAHAGYGGAFDSASLDTATLAVGVDAQPPRPLVTQTAGHGATSALGWDTASSWSDGLAPSADKDYVNNSSGMQTRSPQSSNPVFAGASLTLTNSAAFMAKHSGTATVDDFRVAAGCSIGMVSGTALDGGLALTGNGTIFFNATAANRKLTIDSLMNAGSGIEAIQIYVGGDWDANAFKNTGFTFTDSNNHFAGLWDVQGGYLKGSGFGSGSFRVHDAGYLDFDADFTGSDSDLTILPGGLVKLDQDVTVQTMTIDGQVVFAGTFSGSQLKSLYPSAFDASSLDASELTVLAPHPAATITWTGSDGGQWANASNWDLARMPSMLDAIVIADDHNIDVNTDVTLNGGSMAYALTAGSHTLSFINGSDLRLGNGADVDLVSALSLSAGSVLKLDGSANGFSADRIVVESNATVYVIADRQGIAPITLDDRLVPQPGSKLTIDLREYDIANGDELTLFSAASAPGQQFGEVEIISDLSAALTGTNSNVWKISMVLPSMIPVMEGGTAPNSFEEAWAGYDPTIEPINMEIMREWTEGDITLRAVRYDIGTFTTPYGGTQVSKMAGFYGFPTGATNAPAILQIHGGGGRALLNEVRYAANNGYACLSQNWLGKDLEGAAPGEPNTEWGSVDARQVYHQATFITVEPDTKTIDRVASPRNSNWFLLCVANRRGLTFLQQQPETDGVRLGVTGYSMGGEQTTYLSGVDERLWASCPSVGGSGEFTQSEIDAIGLPGFHNNDPGRTDMSKMAVCRAAMPTINKPILYYGPSNDFNAPSDNLMYNYEHVIPVTTDRRFSIPPHMSHQNIPENEITAMFWFNQHMKGDYTLPDQPVISMDLTGSDEGPVVTVTADTSKPITKVEIFYTIDEQPRTRFWRAVLDVTQTGSNVWKGTCRNIVQGQPLLAYANVFYDYDHNSYTIVNRGDSTPYTGDYLLSSNLEQIPAQDLIDAGTAFVADGSKAMLWDDFTRDWQDWLHKSWTSSTGWQAYTLKPKDPFYKGFPNAVLAMDIKSDTAKSILIGIETNGRKDIDSGSEVTYAVLKSVSGSGDWETITIDPSEFRPTVNGEEPFNDFTRVSWLFLRSGTMTVYNPDGSSETLSSSSWTEAERQFANLRWIVPAADWQSEYSLSNDWTEDVDDDGLSALEEYAFDFNPLTYDSQNFAPFFLNASGELEARYMEMQADVLYDVESTTNLVDGVWTNGAVAFSIDASGMTIGTVPSDQDERFMRLKLQLIP
ncbi:sialate O-acetylesterase [Pontiellaceae bacterium B12227]|nr:sialate O-acetylesterase [Pontiellaceae bacterium B12227]